MYCPQCATANSPDVKFCRSCGTQLEAVALALRTTSPIKKSNKDKGERTAEHWLEKRIKGVSSLTRGSILLTVSLILGVPFELFLPSSFDAPWVLIWAVFFGWMAVWGGIEIAYGISAILEAKTRLRLLGLSSNEIEVQPADPFRELPAVSVTEGTTRRLED